MTNNHIDAMKQALDALREIAWSTDSKWQSDRAQSITEPLREALAEPGAFIQKGYKIAPIKPPENALEVARRAYRNASVYDVAHVWHAIMAALPDSPPAEVPLLTDEDIGMQMAIAWGHASIAPRQAPTFARAIEQLVRQKVGIK